VCACVRVCVRVTSLLSVHFSILSIQIHLNCYPRSFKKFLSSICVHLWMIFLGFNYLPCSHIYEPTLRDVYIYSRTYKFRPLKGMILESQYFHSLKINPIKYLTCFICLFSPPMITNSTCEGPIEHFSRSFLSLSSFGAFHLLSSLSRWPPLPFFFMQFYCAKETVN
jgi:hypothetical protein